MQFDNSIIEAVWNKARTIPDQIPSEWRQDQCGAWLQWEKYNNPKAEYGWKILNVTPGIRKEIDDLQAFHWNNDYDIENNKPQCRVSADRTDLAPGQYIDSLHNKSN